MYEQLSLFDFNTSWLLHTPEHGIEALNDLVDFDLVSRYEPDYVLSDAWGNVIWDNSWGRWDRF